MSGRTGPGGTDFVTTLADLTTRHETPHDVANRTMRFSEENSLRSASALEFMWGGNTGLVGNARVRPSDGGRSARMAMTQSARRQANGRNVLPNAVSFASSMRPMTGLGARDLDTRQRRVDG
jgi:hypothetical protein